MIKPDFDLSQNEQKRVALAERLRAFAIEASRVEPLSEPQGDAGDACSSECEDEISLVTSPDAFRLEESLNANSEGTSKGD